MAVIRIKYYDGPNMSTGFYVLKAGEVLDSITAQSDVTDINTAVEYYNIIRYFDKKIYLATWDTQTIQTYVERVKILRRIVGKLFGSFNSDAIIDNYDLVEHLLREDYIDAIAYYRVYKKLQETDFARFLSTYPSSIGLFIKQDRIVYTFGKAIVDYLISDPSSAELVVSHFFVKHRRNTRQTYMPNELTQEEFEKILWNYVEWQDANSNYLAIIAGLKKSDSFFVNDRIRLKAKRHYREITTALFERNDSHPIEYGVEVQFRNQPEDCKSTIDNNVERLSYGVSWIKENLDYPTLLNNFIYLFGFTDNKMRCQFLSNPDNLGILESVLGIRSEKEYPIGVDYTFSDMKSQLQMIAYKNILSKHGIEVESLFKWFFEEYLHNEFEVKDYIYVAPTSSASDLERILVLITQMDAVLKQFRLYVEDKAIDRELFELSSMPYRIIDTPSMLENKYCYGKSDDLRRAQYLLFSNQSGLNYTEKTGSNSVFFADILISHDVTAADYPDYEQDNIKWLIDKGYIFIDEYNYLRAQITIVNLLYDLHHEGSIAYYYCHELQKEALKELYNKGDIEFESKLFSRREQEYLDYMLNTQQFTNGPELRNKYVHGTFSNNTDTHKKDYIELLKIMVLIIIKINEEFCLKYPENEIVTGVES